MKGAIDFRYEQVHDLVVATPHWKIETQEDVLEWYRQYVEYMKRFSRRVDFVIVCDDLEVKPSIGAFWGEYRAKIHQQFTRHSYRVHTKKNIMVFVNTSGARFNVATQEAATVEDGILGILDARAQQKAG